MVLIMYYSQYFGKNIPDAYVFVHLSDIFTESSVTMYFRILQSS